MTEELQSEMPEAVASITYSLKTPGGFPVLFTMRGEGESPLLERASEIEVFLKDAGYTADIKSYGGGGKGKAPIVYVEGKSCPQCGSKVIEKTTKMGKKMHECEKRVYNFETKQTTGCTFIDWLDETTMAGPEDVNITDGATPNQIRLLKEKGLWEEGMTKSSAGDVIGGVLGK